jgi:hypothetical protein
MLGMPEALPRILFADEFRVVLGDKGWIWYQPGEDHPAAPIATGKFPAAVMVFAVIGIGYKSDRVMVEDSIDTDRYIQSLGLLGFISALDSKYGPLGWILQQDGARSHTSQVNLDWLEESVDVIVDWQLNSPDLSPIELLWPILKKFARTVKLHMIEELKSSLLAAWAMIPQDTIDRLCEGFATRLQLCLANHGDSIPNQFWQINKRHTLKKIFESSAVHTPWTQEEDEQLFRDYLALGPKCGLMARKWGTHSVAQMKNRWYHIVKHRVHTHLGDMAMLTSVFEQGRRGLPIPQLAPD